MTVMIQIRNVPTALHRRLKARAAAAGMSLTDYLLREIQLSAEQPTLEEIRARIESRPITKLTVSPTEILRAERDSR